MRFVSISSNIKTVPVNLVYTLMPVGEIMITIHYKLVLSGCTYAKIKFIYWINISAY